MPVCEGTTRERTENENRARQAPGEVADSDEQGTEASAPTTRSCTDLFGTGTLFLLLLIPNYNSNLFFIFYSYFNHVFIFCSAMLLNYMEN